MDGQPAPRHDPGRPDGSGGPGSSGSSASSGSSGNSTNSGNSGSSANPDGPDTPESPDNPEGQLRLLLDFLNTRDLEADTDAFDTTPGYHAWLVDHGLPAQGGNEPARAVRDALRAAVTGDGSLGAVLGDVPLSAALRTDGQPVLTSPDPLGRLLAVALALAGDGRWHRIRLCPASDCGWAFYDRSKNRSRQWCSMSICGNRTKGRAFRARRREGTA